MDKIPITPTPVQRQKAMSTIMNVYSPTCIYDTSERGWIGFITSSKIFEVTYKTGEAGTTVEYNAPRWGAPENESFRFTESTNRTGLNPTKMYDVPNIMTHFAMMQYIHRGFKKPMNKNDVRYLLRHWCIDRCEMKELPGSEGNGWVFEWYGTHKSEVTKTPTPTPTPTNTVEKDSAK